MWNRASLLLVLVGVVAGYTGRATTAGVSAQVTPEGSPVAVGDTVSLVYQRIEGENVPRKEECVVRDVRGPFVRCSPDKDSGNAEEWRNVTFVVGISKRGK